MIWRLLKFRAYVLYARYLKPMPKLPPLPRQRDRLRRWIVWRRAAGVERYGLRAEQ